MSELYIGLMSGTSMDGIDVALVDFSHEYPQLIAFSCTPFEVELKHKIQQLSSHQLLWLHDYGALDSQLGHLFAHAVNQLLEQSGVSANAVMAIGSHGQTLCHAPHHQYPFSLQVGDPNIIAEYTKITTVADFRRRDIAAKGQGAPLAPAFHQAVFKSLKNNSCVVNIGGIANVSLFVNHTLIAFDTGPGNTLMDAWCCQHLHKPYDDHGRWAATGKVIPSLLENFKHADYFNRSPPKSTGKEYFSCNWLQHHLIKFPDVHACDIQATLCQLTAESILDALHPHHTHLDTLLICGGGVHNHYLLSLLEQGGYDVRSTETEGVHPDHVEALAFAWLAKQTINALSGNLPLVTGAKSSVILGGIYQP